MKRFAGYVVALFALIVIALIIWVWTRPERGTTGTVSTRFHLLGPNDKIAVDGFDRMQIKGGSADRAECGGNFARDDAALAHAGDDNTSAAFEHQIERALEGVAHGAGDAIGEAAQCFRFDADYVFPGAFHRTEDGIKTSGGRCLGEARLVMSQDKVKSLNRLGR